MYIPKLYHIKDEDIAFKIIERFPFATFMTSSPELLFTKTPFDNYNNDHLFGHIAAKNPQADVLKTNLVAEILFDGPHHYISPSVYIKKDVPTWNYISVHLKGKLEMIDQASELLEYLNKMVNRYEDGLTDAFQMNDMPEAILNSYTKAIVGFKFHITTIELKMKLSQNKTEENQIEIMKWLETQNNENAALILEYMKTN